MSREVTVVDDARIESEASVWPGIVLQGDIDSVRVERNT